MATRGELKLLTLGVLLVVVGLTGAEIATGEESTLEEIESEPWFQDTAFVQQGNYVYLIQEQNYRGARINFKIGRTKNLNRRRNVLQIGNPRKLAYVHHPKVKDNIACEKILHKEFSRYKSPLRRQTEWFTVPRAEVNTFKNDFTKTIRQHRQQC